MSAGPVLFSESQRFRQWWLWLVVLATAAIGWVAFWQQIVLGVPFGADPASDATVWAAWLGLGIVLPTVFGSVRLRTTVQPGELRVSFRPLPARVVDLDEVLDVRVVDYKPVANYGGWGYRRTLRGGTAFTVSGRRGVRLGLPGDRHLLVGTQRPEELASALADARRHD